MGHLSVQLDAGGKGGLLTEKQGGGSSDENSHGEAETQACLGTSAYMYRTIERDGVEIGPWLPK